MKLKLPQIVKWSFRRHTAVLTSILAVGCLAISVSGSPSACRETGSMTLTSGVSRYDAKERRSGHVATLPSVLYVSGSPVGIRLESDGVTVLGFVGFMSNGEFVNPGVSGGLQAGDVIISVNSDRVNTSEELRDAVSRSSDGKLKLRLRREDKESDMSLQAHKDDENGEWRIGVWVRDTVTGIGTMTFYDPKSGCFAALGHGIQDNDGLYEISGGSVCKVTVMDAVKGRPGIPGELKGYFPEPISTGGRIQSNTAGGIFGKAGSIFDSVFTLKEYPVMRGDKVHTGKASILTTVCGEQPQEYEVEITATLKDRIYDCKGLTVRVTDKRLIEKTGGIVQGMSGSPLIQDGCVIGAVTHVLINDPTSGYGIYIEGMLEAMANAQKALDSPIEEAA